MKPKHYTHFPDEIHSEKRFARNFILAFTIFVLIIIGHSFLMGWLEGQMEEVRSLISNK